MLSLEEVYHGCIKKMEISRRVMNDDVRTSSFREKILTITVKRGWKAGRRITFEQEGDQGPNSIPADIVFVVRTRLIPFLYAKALTWSSHRSCHCHMHLSTVLRFTCPLWTATSWTFISQTLSNKLTV